MATEATKTPTITTTNHHGHGHHHHHHNHHHVQSQQQQPQYSRNVIENVIKSLDQLILANNVKQILEYNRRISKLLHFNNDLVDDNNLDESSAINSNNNNNGLQNFFRLKNALNVKTVSKWNRVASILKTLDMKANQKEYLKFRSNVHGKKILIIGGGISGLRVSIELLLLGAKVICVEKRDEFTRNNVIHLWPNVINDMCTFESKRFYGKFCVGSIDHISIRQLQLILLKIAIIYGLNFYTNITFTEICPRIIEPRIGRCSSQSTQCDCCCHQHGFGRGSYAHFQLTSIQDSGSGAGQSQTLVNYLNRQSFDVIIGCDGRRHTFSRYFRRNNRRGKLAIGLTANFINHRTEEEVQSEEISGTSRIYQQQWFQNLQDETGIELENLVYYRDNTHYFVMTATKSSLLLRGVLKTDYSDSHQLLSMNNIDTQKLMHYSKDAAEWSSKLRRLEFARNSNNMPDVALFDFTSMYSATNASCAKKIHLRCCCDQSVNINSTENSRYMLLLLCGDSLLEPFWPTGSGAGRGFLSAMDAAWTVAQWFSNVDNSYSIDSMLNVISKREYIYRLLAQTSPENITNKNFSIDPQSRYKTLNILTNDTLKEIKEQVRHLIIDKPDIDMKIYRISNEAKRARRATVGIDPNDILKAKNLHVDTSKLDEFVCQTNHNHHHHLIDYQRNNHHTVLQYSVPSSSSANNNNRQQHCDNRNDSRSPIDVVEFLPRNHSTTATTNNIQNNSTRRPLDVQPRNDRLFSNMAKKNHHARNHFFHQTSNIDQHQQPQHSLHSNDIISNNCLLLSSSPSSSISSNHSKLDWISSSKNDNNLNNTSHESQIIMKQGQQNHNESSGNDKENCPIPDFKQMFLLDDYDDDNGNDDDDYLQSKSKSSMVKNRLNSMSQKMFGNPHHNDSLHDFEKSLSRRPVKKSSDIMEKAQFLEQKFEEHNRSYQPNLNRVGRIEEDDWNVKIWNDTNLFAPKIDKSGRPFVGENSRNLLQSRITQLNNNFEYNRPMISKTFLSSTTTTANANVKNNDFVNMLSAEVCQKLNSGNNNNIVQQQQPSLPIETIIGKTSSGDTTDSQIKITSAFRDPSTNIRSRIPGSSDLLKPIGDCYRCLKTLLANDRVTILGRNFHRNCLTCKICNVSLRHDELMASIDDFICKICLKIRSRQIDDIDNDSNNIIMTTSTGSTFSNSSMINDSKNAFLSQAPLSSSLNLSLMEAKKNFLENAQQIDLRERAEFELIIDDDDNTNPSNQSDNNDNDVEQQQDDVEFDIENDENQQEEINDDVDDQKQNDEQEQLQQQQQSSDLSDSSDVHCSSSDNYTDDEHSSDSSSSSSCLPQRPSSIKSSTTVPLHKSSSSSSSSSSTSSNSANQKNVDHSYNIDFGSGFTSLIGTTSTTNTPTTVTNDDNSSIMNVNDDDNDDGCVEMVATTNSKNSLTTDSITTDPIAASNLPLLSNDAYYYDGSSQCSINFNDFDEKHLPLTSTMTTELTQNEPIVQCANITQMANDNNDQNRIDVDLNCCQFVDAVDNDCDQSILKLESPKSKINNASSAKHSHNQSSPGLKKESLIFNFNRKEPLNIDSIIKTKQQQQQEMTTMTNSKTATTISNDNGNGKNKSSTSNNNNHSKKNIGSGNVVTQIKPITTTTTKPSNIPTYRYDGHFTEKFYRSQSQPSLFAQMDHIGNKLKMKRNYSPTTTTTTNIGDNNANTVSIKLPFVDGSPPKNDDNNDNDKILSTPKTIFNQHRTTTNNTTTNNNNDQQSSNSSSIKSSLTQAPFARIDDV